MCQFRCVSVPYFYWNVLQIFGVIIYIVVCRRLSIALLCVEFCDDIFLLLLGVSVCVGNFPLSLQLKDGLGSECVRWSFSRLCVCLKDPFEDSKLVKRFFPRFHGQKTGINLTRTVESGVGGGGEEGVASDTGYRLYWASVEIMVPIYIYI